MGCSAEAVRLPGLEGDAVKLSSNALRATIAPERGAEIASLCLRCEERETELVFRAGDFSEPPEDWSGRGPILFPAVGRTFMEEMIDAIRRGGEQPSPGAWRCEGREYPMPCHGFAMRSAFKLVQSGVDTSRAWAELELADDESTRAHYPFGFHLSVTYEVLGKCLRARHRVSASPQNEYVMPFTIGNHISFRCPVFDEGDFEEAEIESDTFDILTMTPWSLPTGEVAADGRGGGRRALSERQYLDCILTGFTPENACFRYVDPSGLHITVRQMVGGAVDTGETALRDTMAFVLYGVREDGVFCPEPWLGLPNALNSGKGCIFLKPGDEATWIFSITAASATC